MQASQLIALNNAKRILEECGCFRGPTGDTGPPGPEGPPGYSLLFYSDGTNIDPYIANTDPSVYGIFIGADGSLWRSAPATVLDTSFTASLNAPVLCITKQTNGYILVGGTFSGGITRFTSFGETDATFTIGTGFNAAVRTIAVQSDSKIIIGGDFTTYNGSPVSYIARLNVDGTLDTTFNTGVGFDGPVHTLVLQSNQKIVAGGAFNYYDGYISPHLVRITSGGFYDPTFDVGFGFDSTVYTVALDNNEYIYAGGSFTQYNTNLFVEHIVRIQSDGNEDTEFVADTGFNGDVYFIKYLDSSNIVVVGSFTQYQTSAVNRVIQLSANGNTVNTYGYGLNGPANTIATQLNGNLLCGGTFTSYNNVSTNNITRLLTSDPYPFMQGFNSSVYSIYIENSTQFLVGGSFTQYNSSTANYVVRLKETPYSWSNTGTNLTALNTAALNSTIVGLGTFGYISSATGTGGLSQSNLNSTIVGLGTFGYISSATGTGGLSQSNLTSTIVGLGTFGYLSTNTVPSTILGLGTFGYISSSQLLSTTQGITQYFPSTVDGLGSANYISSSQLTSTTQGITQYFPSTIDGLGSANYISSSQLLSTVSGFFTQYKSLNIQTFIF